MIDNARDRQVVFILEREHRVARQIIEKARDRDRRELGIEIAQKRQIILHRLDLDAAVAEGKLRAEHTLHLGDGQALAGQLGQALDRGIDLLDPIPCRLAYHAVGRKVEDPLELRDRLRSLAVIDGGGGVDARDGGIVAADAVELVLDGAHIVAEGAARQGGAGIRLRFIGQGRVLDQLDIVAVVVLQDLHGGIALIGEVDRTPLEQSAAHGDPAVAELGGKRLDRSLAADIVVEDIIHDQADGIEHLAVLGVGVVIAGIVGDIKIIAAAGIILGIDAVEGIGYLR